ncbi:MAG TPA: hypothetical protein VIK18_24985 [Pirellulales bacterium]
MSRKAWWLILALSLGASGCKAPSVQEQFISLKNRSWAKIAWAQEFPRYRKQPAPIRKTFGAGWREAYYDVAQGGSGKIPLFPPIDYWGVKYQNPMGRDQIDAWFAGYRVGAIAAQQDNVGFWIQIPMSGGDKAPQADVTTIAEPPAEQVPASDAGTLPLPPPENLPPARQTGYLPGSATIRAAADPIRR